MKCVDDTKRFLVKCGYYALAAFFAVATVSHTVFGLRYFYREQAGMAALSLVFAVCAALLVEALRQKAQDV